MPQPDELDDLLDPIVKAYARAWQRVEAEQAALADDPLNLTKRRRLREMQKRIGEVMQGLDEEAAEWVATRLPEAYALGGAVGAGEAAAEFAWSQIHQEAVQRLATGLFHELLGATEHVNDTTKKLIRSVARDSALQAAIQGRTAKQASVEMRRILQDRGISAVTYRDGSVHGLAEYSQMAIRTTTATAYNQGTLNGAANEGVKYWEIFDGPECGLSFHDDPTLAAGLIVDKDTAEKYVISHPNCRRAFGARPDLKTKAEAAKAKGSVTPEQMEAQRAQDAARRGKRSVNDAGKRPAAPKEIAPTPAVPEDTLAGGADARRARLRASYDSGIASRTPLEGGRFGGEMLEFNDGTKAVLRGRGSKSINANLRFEDVAGELGAETMVSVRLPGNKLLSEFIEGTSPDRPPGLIPNTKEFKAWQASRNAPIETEAGKRLALADYVTNHADRTDLNWIIRDGKPVAIDNDSAFDPYPSGGGLRPQWRLGTGSRGTDLARKDLPRITKAEVQEARAKIEAISERFTDEQMEGMRRRLDLLEERAPLTNDELKIGFGLAQKTKLVTPSDLAAERAGNADLIAARKKAAQSRARAQRRAQRKDRTPGEPTAPKTSEPVVPSPPHFPLESLDGMEKSYQEALGWVDSHGAAWAHSLSDAETAAVRGYTEQGGSWAINDALRSGKRLDEVTIGGQSGEVLQEAVLRGTLDEDLVVWRGRAEYHAGEEFALEKFGEAGFLSTSLSRYTAEAYMQDEPGVLYRIIIPKGTRGTAIPSSLTNGFEEAEILLPPGTRFIWQETRSPRGGQRIITLQVVG